MQKRYIWLLGWTTALLLILTMPVHAQEKHCLWRIETETNTVYLLGSLHMLKPAHYPLSESIVTAFADARHIATEVNIDSMLAPNVITTMAMKAMYTDGTSLQQNVSENTFLQTQNIVQEFGLDMQRLSPFRPWFVALSILGLKLQQLGFNPEHGIDRHLFMNAKKEKKGLHALESVDFQIGILASLSEEQQEMMLLQTLRDLKIVEEFFDDIYTAWHGGDAEKLDGLLLESFKEFPAVYSKLITDRNRNWIPHIERYLLQDENYMVIVGAGHLVGEDSVVEMLRTKGYTVEQL